MTAVQTSPIITSNAAKNGAVDVYTVGKIDLSIYRCVSDDITTDEVVITEERIEHIRQRHPNDYERYKAYLTAIVQEPDYIIRDSRPFTAIVLKEIEDAEQHNFRLVLRLATSQDANGLKNSIITFMATHEKEYQRLIRNKEILYKKK